LCRIADERGLSYWTDSAHQGVLREAEIQLISPQVDNNLLIKGTVALDLKIAFSKFWINLI
jgi:hypothetical protein